MATYLFARSGWQILAICIALGLDGGYLGKTRSRHLALLVGFGLVVLSGFVILAPENADALNALNKGAITIFVFSVLFCLFGFTAVMGLLWPAHWCPKFDRP